MIRRLYKRILISLSLLTCLTAIAQNADFLSEAQLERLSQLPLSDPFIQVFNKQCAVCHGEDLLGAAQGTPLVGVDLRYGSSIEAITKSIADGFPESGSCKKAPNSNYKTIFNCFFPFCI